MNETPLIFGCDGETLVGILHRASGVLQRNIGILVVVGGPQYRAGSHRQFVLMARNFAAAGYAVLRFDFRGSGDSTGAQRTFESIGRDIRAAVDAMLAAQPGLRGIVIFGLCDAASAALMYCSTDQRLLGLILANPWVRTDTGIARTMVRHYYLRRFAKRSFWSKVLSGGFDLRASLRSLRSSLRLLLRGESGKEGTKLPHFVERMLEGFRNFHSPILVLLSDRDFTAREFQDLCHRDTEWSRCVRRSNVQQQVITDSDHTFSSRASLQDACASGVMWLEKLCPRAATASGE